MWGLRSVTYRYFVGMLVSRIGGGSGGWACVPLWCILLLAGVVGLFVCYINTIVVSMESTLCFTINRQHVKHSPVQWRTVLSLTTKRLQTNQATLQSSLNHLTQQPDCTLSPFRIRVVSLSAYYWAHETHKFFSTVTKKSVILHDSDKFWTQSTTTQIISCSSLTLYRRSADRFI